MDGVHPGVRKLRRKRIPSEDTPKKEDDTINEAIVVQKPPQKDPVATDDFVVGFAEEWLGTSDEIEEFEDETVRTESETKSRTRRGVRMEETVETITRVKRRVVKLSEHNKRAVEDIPEEIYFKSLDLLDDYVDLPKAIMELITDVHACCEKPHLISMRAGNDISRKGAVFCVRPDINGPTQETFRSPQYSIIKVKEQGGQLARLLIHKALSNMYPSYVRPISGDTEAEGFGALARPYRDGRMSKIVRCTLEEDEDEESPAIYSLDVCDVETKRVLISALKQERFAHFNKEAIQGAELVRDAVNIRVDRITQDINKCDIPDSKIYLFLEQAKEAKLGIKTTPIPNLVRLC